MMMSSVVIFEMYAASYTAFLAVSKLASPFDSLEDMYENTDYRIGAIVSTPFKDIITGVGLEVEAEEAGSMQAGDQNMARLVEERWQEVKSTEEGVQRMLQGGYGFLNPVQVGSTYNCHQHTATKE